MTLIFECDGERRTYKPSSDLSLWRSGLPRLLFRVDSGDPLPADEQLPGEHIRLLLQGAAAVRFANNFVDRYKDSKTFVLVTIYFTRDAKAHRHIMYQEPRERPVLPGENVQDTVHSAAL
jgi:hypothetical protein